MLDVEKFLNRAPVSPFYEEFAHYHPNKHASLHHFLEDLYITKQQHHVILYRNLPFLYYNRCDQSHSSVGVGMEQYVSNIDLLSLLCGR